MAGKSSSVSVSTNSLWTLGLIAGAAYLFVTVLAPSLQNILPGGGDSGDTADSGGGGAGASGTSLANSVSEAGAAGQDLTNFQIPSF